MTVESKPVVYDPPSNPVRAGNSTSANRIPWCDEVHLQSQCGLVDNNSRADLRVPGAEGQTGRRAGRPIYPPRVAGSVSKARGGDAFLCEGGESLLVHAVRALARPPFTSIGTMEMLVFLLQRCFVVACVKRIV